MHFVDATAEQSTIHWEQSTAQTSKEPKYVRARHVGIGHAHNFDGVFIRATGVKVAPGLQFSPAHGLGFNFSQLAPEVGLDVGG